MNGWVDSVKLTDETISIIGEISSKYCVSPDSLQDCLVGAISKYKTLKVGSDNEELSSDGREKVRELTDQSLALIGGIRDMNFNTEDNINNGLMEHGFDTNQRCNLNQEFEALTDKIQNDLHRFCDLLDIGMNGFRGDKRSNPTKSFVDQIATFFDKNGIPVTSAAGNPHLNYKGEGVLHKVCRHLLRDAGGRGTTVNEVKTIQKWRGKA